MGYVANTMSVSAVLLLCGMSGACCGKSYARFSGYGMVSPYGAVAASPRPEDFNTPFNRLGGFPDIRPGEELALERLLVLHYEWAFPNHSWSVKIFSFDDEGQVETIIGAGGSREHQDKIFPWESKILIKEIVFWSAKNADVNLNAPRVPQTGPVDRKVADYVSRHVRAGDILGVDDLDKLASEMWESEIDLRAEFQRLAQKDDMDIARLIIVYDTATHRHPKQ